MKKINIAFTDFWDGFNIYDNFIINVLKKRFEVNIIEGGENFRLAQYLFYSCFGSDHLLYDCIKIFYTGENLTPDFNLCDYAIGFDFLEFGDRYIRLPIYAALYERDVRLMMNKHQDLMVPEKFCSFVYSNNDWADESREKFFRLLSDYKRVDSGGRYLNNIGMPEGVPDKYEFQKKYKFSIAFENSSRTGYCTEKIVQSFAAGTIPIYWGDPSIKNFFNSKAFINCHDYENFEQVVQRIIEIDQNDEIYLAMKAEPAILDSQKNPYDMFHDFEIWINHIMNQNLECARRIPHNGKIMVYKKQQEKLFYLEKKYARFEFENKPTNFVGKIRRKIQLLRR